MLTIIYSRVSTADQVDGVSLQAQASSCSNFCLHNDIGTPLVIQEISSAYNNIPPQLLALQYKRNCRIVFYSVDRFSRYYDLGLKFALHLLHRGCRLVFLREELCLDKSSIKTPDFELFKIKLIMAQSESDNIGARVKASREWMTKNEYFIGSTPPYGYTLVPDLVNPKFNRLKEHHSEYWIINFIKMCRTKDVPVDNINKQINDLCNSTKTPPFVYTFEYRFTKNDKKIVSEYTNENVTPQELTQGRVCPLKKLKYPLTYKEIAYILNECNVLKRKIQFTPQNTRSCIEIYDKYKYYDSSSFIANFNKKIKL